MTVNEYSKQIDNVIKTENTRIIGSLLQTIKHQIGTIRIS